MVVIDSKNKVAKDGEREREREIERERKKEILLPCCTTFPLSLSLYPLSVLGHCHFLFPYRALRTMFAEYFNFTITNHQSKKKVITSRCIVIYNRQILFYTMIQKNVMKSLLLTVKLQTIVVFFCKDCFFVGESRWSVLTSLPFPILGILR